MPGYVIHLATAYVHLRTQCDVHVSIARSE